MKKSKQIERIEEMETIYDDCIESTKNLEKNLKEFNRLQKKIDRLEEYYFSNQWRKDYEDDEKGKIDKSIKRGVLSQDGIYNLLIANDELIEKIRKKTK